MINREIYELVKSCNGCEWGLSRIEKANSVDAMIRILKTAKGVEFAMDQDFLPMSILEKHRMQLEKENIFFDGTHKVFDPRFVLALGGNVTVEVSDFQVAELYVKNACISVLAKDYAFVSIEKNNSKVNIELLDNAKVKEFLK